MSRNLGDIGFCEKTYFIRNILNTASLAHGLYESKRRPYGYPLTEALKSFSVCGKKNNGLNLCQLEILCEAFIKALRIKHKHKNARIAKDKSNMMKAYLRLFEFIQKEKEWL